MFTGLVRERGRVACDPRPSGLGGVRLGIEHGGELGSGLEVGSSLAVAGVCLTVTEIESAASEDRVTSWVEVSPETLARTTLGDLGRGAEVNLEPALRAGEPLGGHMVQGHVDGTARVVARREAGEHRVLAIELPEELAPFLVVKGSVAVDGVSLTVAALPSGPRPSFEVALIPHTLAMTTLRALEAGNLVNLEVDVIAKYVARMLAARGLVPEMPESAAERPGAWP